MTRRHFNRVALSGSIVPVAFPHLLQREIETDRDLSLLRRIPKTDTHMHLFGLNILEYPWLKNAPAINRNFLPSDFIEATKRSNVDKIVFMESGATPESSLKEVKWVIEQAAKDPRIKGIVAKGRIQSGGTIDPPVDDLLATGWVKGIRGATNAETLASSGFVKSMKLLAEKNLTFDLLLRPPLFRQAAQAIRKAPDISFVLDHLGNPDIEGGDFESWKTGIDELATCPNLNCKISGLLTKAGPKWTTKMLKPYVYHVIERFGFDRIVYGGDWPVVLLAGSYRSWSKAFEKLTRPFSEEELHKLYHRNADRIYNLL